MPIPPRPDHVSEDLWQSLAEQVKPTITAAGLEALAGQVQLARQAAARVAEEGMIVADDRGNPAPHPAIALERAAQAEVRQWMGKFGKPAKWDTP